MRVLMVLRDAPLPGGLEHAVATIGRALTAQGFLLDVVVLTRADGPGRSASVFDGVLPVQRIEQDQLAGWVRRADVVHVHAQDALHWPHSLLLTARRAGRPVVLTVHLPSYPPRGAWSPGRVRVSATLVALGAALRLLGAVVRAPSTQAAADARRRFGRLVPVGVLPNAVPDAGVADWPTGPVRLALVGRLEGHKEPQTFLDAVALAVAQGVDLHADVVGDGPLRDALTAAVARAGLTERVRFHGWLDDPGPVIAAAQALVLTSRSEGAVPLVALAAAGLGRGLVVRDGLEGFADRWTDAVHRVPAQAEAADFAAAFVQLAADPDRLVRMGSAARAAFDHGPTPTSGAQTWGALYRSAVDRRPR